MRTFKVENLSNYVMPGKKAALKHRDMELTGYGLKPLGYTAGGMPQCDQIVIKKLAGKSPSEGKFGLAYDHFKS